MGGKTDTFGLEEDHGHERKGIEESHEGGESNESDKEDASDKSGHGPANGVTKPFNTNVCFIPNGNPCTAYSYGDEMVIGVSTGYNGQDDWNVYSRFVNLNGGMTQVSTTYSGH
ncbi:hypothetical protein SESBI_12753 [Sesbania bispinosa]|nr:hypothetical protein SESBI_12753 [Sesbania bispinosa]